MSIFSRLRNGSTVEETSNVTLSSIDDSHSLTVKEVTVLDFATYSIRAANLAGEAEATANLTEKGTSDVCCLRSEVYRIKEILLLCFHCELHWKSDLMAFRLWSEIQSNRR